MHQIILFLEEVDYFSFFLALAGIFAAILSINFSILLANLGELSRKYNSYTIAKNFFRNLGNILSFVVMVSGVVLSLSFALLNSGLEVAVFMIIYLLFSLWLMINTYFSFTEYANPVELVEKNLLGLKKNKGGKKKEDIGQIKEISFNSRQDEVEKIEQKLLSTKKGITNDKEKDEINSIIKDIGRNFARTNASISFYSMFSLLSSGESDIEYIKGKEGNEYLIHNTINYSRAILHEVQRYNNSNFSVMDIELLFGQFYWFSKKLKSNNFEMVLNNSEDLMKEVNKFVNNSALTKEEKGLLDMHYRTHRTDIKKITKANKNKN